MVLIDSFLPNPVGKDSAGEYIVIKNTDDSSVSLTGWQLKDASGKSFNLNGFILSAGQSLKFESSVTKISLGNSGETVSLIDASGSVIDTLSYAGTAAEGYIVRHITELTPELKAQMFDDLAFKKLPEQIGGGVSSQVYIFGLCVAIALATIATIVYNKIHENDQSKDNPFS